MLETNSVMQRIWKHCVDLQPSGILCCKDLKDVCKGKFGLWQWSQGMWETFWEQQIVTLFMAHRTPRFYKSLSLCFPPQTFLSCKFSICLTLFNQLSFLWNKCYACSKKENLVDLMGTVLRKTLNLGSPSVIYLYSFIKQTLHFFLPQIFRLSQVSSFTADFNLTCRIWQELNLTQNINHCWAPHHMQM